VLAQDDNLIGRYTYFTS